MVGGGVESKFSVQLRLMLNKNNFLSLIVKIALSSGTLFDRGESFKSFVLKVLILSSLVHCNLAGFHVVYTHSSIKSHPSE